MGRPYDGTAYRKRREALKRKCMAENTPCYLCGKPINFLADRKAGDSFEAEHVESLHRGGKALGLLLPSHKSCNGSKQDLTVEEFREKRAKRQPAPTRRTTQW